MILKQPIYITHNIDLKKMKTVHFNILYWSDNHCGWRLHLGLRMDFNHIVHPLMNVSSSWKNVFSVEKIIREIYFHHLAMNYYLHQEILHWKFALFFIYWNRSISVIIILDVSCQVVWCLMTSSWIYSGTRNWNAITKKMIVFLQRSMKNIYLYRGVTSRLLLE